MAPVAASPARPAPLSVARSLFWAMFCPMFRSTARGVGKCRGRGLCRGREAAVFALGRRNARQGAEAGIAGHGAHFTPLFGSRHGSSHRISGPPPRSGPSVCKVGLASQASVSLVVRGVISGEAGSAVGRVAGHVLPVAGSVAHAPALSSALPPAGAAFTRRIHAGHVLSAAGSVAHTAPHAGTVLFHFSFHTVSAAHAASAPGARAVAFRACIVIARHMNLLLF